MAPYAGCSVGISHVVVYIPLSMWIWIWGCVWLSAPFYGSRWCRCFLVENWETSWEMAFPQCFHRISLPDESVGCYSQPFLSKDNKPLHQYFSLKGKGKGKGQGRGKGKGKGSWNTNSNSGSSNVYQNTDASMRALGNQNKQLRENQESLKRKTIAKITTN